MFHHFDIKRMTAGSWSPQLMPFVLLGWSDGEQHFTSLHFTSLHFLVTTKHFAVCLLLAFSFVWWLTVETDRKCELRGCFNYAVCALNHSATGIFLLLYYFIILMVALWQLSNHAYVKAELKLTHISINDLNGEQTFNNDTDFLVIFLLID